MVRPGWVLGWGVLCAVGSAGCAGSPGLGFYTGACETERDRCRARCERLADPRRCLDRCDQDARTCQTRQGGEGVVLEQPPLRIGEHQALLVELDAGRVRASEAAQTRIQGEARPIEGAFALPPGAGLEVVFTLPPTAREADLEVTHGPGEGAGPCFVTMVVGYTPLAGRYAPPRGRRAPARELEPDPTAAAARRRGRGAHAAAVHLQQRRRRQRRRLPPRARPPDLPRDGAPGRALIRAAPVSARRPARTR